MKEACLNKCLPFFEYRFSKPQCGCRKGQQSLVTLLEKWKNAVNNGKNFGFLQTDL